MSLLVEGRRGFRPIAFVLSKAYTLHAYIDGFGQHHCDLTAINAERAQRYRQRDKCYGYLKRHFTFHITLTSLNLQTLYLKG